LPENQATNAWRAMDTPRHGHDDGSFRTSLPAREIVAPPSSFEAARLVSTSPRRRVSRKDDGAKSLFARLLQAVRSWRRGRDGPKTVRYACITMEQLDHRQILSVNFTGNVPIDFPATQAPGVVLLPDNPLVQHPVIAPAIARIQKSRALTFRGFESVIPRTTILSASSWISRMPEPPR
jgi:hypothetical protein